MANSYEACHCLAKESQSTVENADISITKCYFNLVETWTGLLKTQKIAATSMLGSSRFGHGDWAYGENVPDSCSHCCELPFVF